MGGARPRVLVDKGRWVREEDWDSLTQIVEPLEPAGDEPLDEEALIAALEGCAGVMRLGRRLPALTRRVLDAAPALEIAAIRSDRFGTGLDLEAAWERGIKVVDIDNIASAHPVAEWVLALMLLCLRNAGALYRQMMAGTERWGQGAERAPGGGNEAFVNGELTGRKVGLVGCGHVGQRLVELLAPFRVDVKVCDPYLPDELAARLGIMRDDLDGVLRHAEILVVQVPLTPRTTHLIGARELELLGRGKILVNCSRGRVLDQEALLRKLQAGELIAGLDVFDPEPLPPDSPLRFLPNAFLTPHIAWHAPNVLHRYFAFAAAEIARFFTGQPLQFELTPRMVAIRHGTI
jgi:phosphoglycerate dehydrogenase-like enzyme